MLNNQPQIARPFVFGLGPTIVVTFVLWLLIAWATYHGWIHGADHRDFYPRWAGARLTLFEGQDLYADSTTRQMQMMLYGHELEPDRDQQAFAYPALLIPVLLPFWFIDDVEIATAAWEATSVLILLGTLLLVRKVHNTAPHWLIVVLLLWYYPTLMIFQAQITALPLAAVGLGYWAYTQRRDALSGAILVIGFIKPEQALVPILLMLLCALHERRWRILTAFFIAGGSLMVASFLINGWWIPRWLAAIQRYATYAPTAWGPATAWNLHPIAGVAFIGILVFMVLRLPHNIFTATAAGIPLGLMLLPQTLIWGLTMLIVPLLLAYQKRTRLWVLLIWILGWVLIAGSGMDGWWRIQTLILCLATLGIVVYASRLVSLQPGK